MKYKKKPVIIEAHKWEPFSYSALTSPIWFNEAISCGKLWPHSNGDLRVFTLEDGGHAGLQAKHVASPGDYIIKGVLGELYPCKPDIFELTYEPVL